MTVEKRLKLSWPGYQDMPIKAISEIAEGFAKFLADQFGIKSELELTAEGIIFNVDEDMLLRLLGE